MRSVRHPFFEEPAIELCAAKHLKDPLPSQAVAKRPRTRASALAEFVAQSKIKSAANLGDLAINDVFRPEAAPLALSDIYRRNAEIRRFDKSGRRVSDHDRGQRQKPPKIRRIDILVN